MANVNITLRIDSVVLDQVDKYCKNNKITRSDFIRSSIVEKITEPELLEVKKGDIKSKIETFYKILDINFNTQKFVIVKGNSTVTLAYQLVNKNKQLIIRDTIGKIVNVISML